eukprot:15451399-Alexandrium_andersonii.AAC.1
MFPRSLSGGGVPEALFGAGVRGQAAATLAPVPPDPCLSVPVAPAPRACGRPRGKSFPPTS